MHTIFIKKYLNILWDRINDCIIFIRDSTTSDIIIRANKHKWLKNFSYFYTLPLNVNSVGTVPYEKILYY